MLVLVGSGEYLPAIEPVDRKLISRLDSPVRVVCLPTAAGTEGAERIHYWSQLGVDHFTRLGVQAQALPVIDAESANRPEFAQVIEESNFVYLSGGKPAYLHQVLQGSRVWQAIQSVLAKGGVLAGCSAGAMIMGEKFLGFPQLLLKNGFDLLPKALIMPHYDEMGEGRIAPVRLLMGKDITLLGIEGNTALVRSGDKYEVLGTGGVTVWNHAGKQRYTQGPLPRWHQD